MKRNRIMLFLMIVFCMLLCVWLQKYTDVDLHTAQVFLTSDYYEYPCAFNVREDDVLEVIFGSREYYGKAENYSEIFGQDVIKKEKRLSISEKNLLNNLIAKIKMNSDSDFRAVASGLLLIWVYVNVDGKTYESFYIDEQGQEDVQALAYKLIQLSPVITPFSSVEAVRLYSNSEHQEVDKIIGKEFRKMIGLIEMVDGHPFLNTKSDEYRKIIRDAWGSLAVEN